MTEGYEVAYHDGQSTNETKVSVNRLRAVDHSVALPDDTVRQTEEKFVGDFALRLEPMLFMPGDAIIESALVWLDVIPLPGDDRYLYSGR